MSHPTSLHIKRKRKIKNYNYNCHLYHCKNCSQLLSFNLIGSQCLKLGYWQVPDSSRLEINDDTCTSYNVLIKMKSTSYSVRFQSSPYSKPSPYYATFLCSLRRLVGDVCFPRKRSRHGSLCVCI